jgi:small-conductance mechanosensitive channel/CRP-like cAMP-binding protein
VAPLVAAAPFDPLGLAVGLVLLLVGALLLRALVRARALWWSAAAAPLLLFGPAIGLLLGSWWAGGPVLFGGEPDHEIANLAWSVLAFFGATSLLAVVRKFLQSRIVREELGIRVPDLLLDAGRLLLWVAMSFVVVGVIWGRTDLLTPLFTASAVGTVILGLALQETLVNFFAGVTLLTEGIYAPGDWVVIGEVEGEVVRMTRRSTQILTRSHDVVTLGNRQVASGPVRNLSRPGGVHNEVVVVSAPYEVPPNRVREALAAALRATPQVLAEPPSRVRLHAYGASGIDYEVRFAVGDMRAIPDIRSAVQVRIWYEFRRAGITFPYPVREVRRLAEADDGRLSVEGARERLRASPLLGALPSEVLDRLADAARTELYADGECVVREGEEGDACYIVDEGRVVVSVAATGAEQQVSELGPGGLFGEMGMLTGEPRSATVSARGDCRLLVLSSAALADALAEAPDLANTLAEVVALRREGLTQARAALDATAQARVARERGRLGALIRRFLKLGQPEE